MLRRGPPLPVRIARSARRAAGGVLSLVALLPADLRAQTPAPTAPASTDETGKARLMPPAPMLLEEPTQAPFARAEDPIDLLEDAIELIESEYVEGQISRAELVEAALRGMVEHLNRRAPGAGGPSVNALLTRRDVGRLTDALTGEAVGIGVLARPVANGGIEVLKVFDGSPAGKAGLKAGDRISAVDDYPVSGVEAFALLRGSDSAPVRLQVFRAGAAPEATPVEVKVVRTRYRISTVRSSILPEDVGYVSVGKLTRGAADDVAGALLDFANAPGPAVWGVLLDLRGNPGGSLQEATRIAEMFVTPGEPLFQIETKSQPQTVFSSGERLFDGPVTVLVDPDTASAAEALAAALQSNGALLVGEPTAGRGLGETIFALPSGGGLRLATARYRTAAGLSWIGVGLQPSAQVPPTIPGLPEELDPQVKNAVDIMRLAKPAAPDVNVANPAALRAR